MYIKINGEDTHYDVSVKPFTTQHGANAIRFVGDEMPTTDKGFKYYDDEDNEIADYSDYTYEYRHNEYSDAYDEIVYPVGSDAPLKPSPIDVRLSNMSRQISAITPYEQSKTAYYGEIEKVFYGVPSGNVSVFFDNYDGAYDIVRVEDRVTITFPERLADMTNINISVQ